MDRIKQEVIILDLLKAMKQAESWCGETHLQKSVYFLQEGLGLLLDLPFVLYKHGPYSFELHELLGEMKANLLIDLKAQPYPYGPSFVPTETGQVLADRFPKTLIEISNQLGFVSRTLSTRNVSELEKMCTALFISKKESGRSDNDIARYVAAIKPHIKIDEAMQALKQVRELVAEAKS